MKKTLLLSFILLLTTFASQAQQFISKSSLHEVKKLNTEYTTRKILITATAITITKFINGGKDDLKVKVDKITEKDFQFYGTAKWYYCTDMEKDVISGTFRKYIIVIPKSQDAIHIFDFADETTMYYTELLLR